MTRRAANPNRIAFGDFQTPAPLATDVCALLAATGTSPASIVEPTCGVGAFLIAAKAAFPSVRRVLAVDVNQKHLDQARTAFADSPGPSPECEFLHADFFEAAWQRLLVDLPSPVLILGNPPWVTNSDLGAMGSANLPRKSNFHSRAGLDAITGKSNFDISEWMLLKMLEWTKGRDASVAMLCKTAVARKVLEYAWSRDIPISKASIRRIDAQTHFGASVEACLLVWSGVSECGPPTCSVYENLDDAEPSRHVGYRDGHLVADIESYSRGRHVLGKARIRWRSGIKHDCAAVMELTGEAGAYRNALGESLDLEDRYLFPMLKSSEVANGVTSPSRVMLVPQQSVGENTSAIALTAPRTWNYLQGHTQRFARRASSIYRNRPAFSVFGVGEYSFAPWKVAVSGLYKRLAFRVIGPHREKPVVLDDTCYFVPCETREDAELLLSLLDSPPATAAFRALIFWDAKRPITAEVLHCIDLVSVARDQGVPVDAVERLVSYPTKPAVDDQLALLAAP